MKLYLLKIEKGSAKVNKYEPIDENSISPRKLDWIRSKGYVQIFDDSHADYEYILDYTYRTNDDYSVCGILKRALTIKLMGSYIEKL